MNTPRYEVIDHTADFAFRVTAPDLPGLVRAAVLAVIDAAWGLETIRPGAVPWRAVVPADDPAMAIFLALSEILFLVDAHGMIPADVVVADEGLGGLSLRLDCDRFDPSRHHHRIAFKAATLHGLAVVPGGEGLETVVLMDT